jgi:16S rRNA (guanine(966)-N(2))-methyltransferase RsmD
MRIISGTYRGRLLPAPPKNFKARPTTDFAKENLFNILANRFDFEAVDVLDLFAGTGGISLEFASRGCRSTDTVEIEQSHCRYIANTATLLKMPQIHVVHNDVFLFLRLCRKTYDIIFADPPYSNENVRLIPDIVAKRQLLKESGRLIVEHSSTNDFTGCIGFVEQRRYGSVNFSFFEKTTEQIQENIDVNN